jgi:hypothetical protein
VITQQNRGTVRHGEFYFSRLAVIKGSDPASRKRGAESRVEQSRTRVEAGSNTSTVTLRVVGGDEKGNLKSETAKYGRESQGTRTREHWQGSAAYTKDRPVLSSEMAPHKNKTAVVKQD